jgi:hypothetical protein
VRCSDVGLGPCFLQRTLQDGEHATCAKRP